MEASSNDNPQPEITEEYGEPTAFRLVMEDYGDSPTVCTSLWFCDVFIYRGHNTREQIEIAKSNCDALNVAYKQGKVSDSLGQRLMGHVEALYKCDAEVESLFMRYFPANFGNFLGDFRTGCRRVWHIAQSTIEIEQGGFDEPTK